MIAAVTCRDRSNYEEGSNYELHLLFVSHACFFLSFFLLPFLVGNGYINWKRNWEATRDDETRRSSSISQVIMTRKASAKVTPTVPGRRESKQASSNATASATASASSRGRSSTADKRKDLRRPLSSQASKDIDGTSTVRIPASGAKSVVAEEGLGPFLVVSQDVGGLLVSSFLVPSVRFPFRGVPAWVATVLLQIGLMIYIAVYLNTKEGFGPCSTPAVLQVLAIYVFLLRSVTSASDSVGLFQVAAKCMRVRHELEMKIIPARKLTRRCRISLVMVPVIDFLVEITTFIVGAIMLLNSSSILDCVLNSLALHTNHSGSKLFHSFLRF